MLVLPRTFGHNTPRFVSVLHRARQLTIQSRRIHSARRFNSATSVSTHRNLDLEQIRHYTQHTDNKSTSPAKAMSEGAHQEGTQETPLGLSFPEWIKSPRVMPRLTEEDLSERLCPLTDNYLWQKMSRITENDHLYRRYVFKGPKSARHFVAFLMQVEEEYDHHTSFTLSSQKRPVVQVLTQTHVMDGGPGISLKDLHLAALIEQHYRSGNYMPKMVDATLRDVWNLST